MFLGNVSSKKVAFENCKNPFNICLCSFEGSVSPARFLGEEISDIV